MLTNYYYDKRYHSDIDAIVHAIQSGFPEFKPNAKLSNVSDIQLKNKLYQLRNEFQWERKDLTPYLYAIDVRNAQSHRSLVVDRDLIRETEEKLKSANAWTSYNKPVYFAAPSIVGKKVWNEYNFQVWLDQQPFSEVTDAIRRLSDTVASTI